MPVYDTILDLGKKLANDVTTSTVLTQSALDKINAPDGEGKRVFIRRNDDRAMKLAASSDTLRQAGFTRSPLEGLPISIKDLFDIEGEVTTAGSLAMRDASAATANAPVVERLIAAGAVITGTTNMSEFAFSGLGLNPHYDTPRNPFDRATGRIPGGSSSGAAISVTEGMSVAAIGTDTGGSIRIPAALCGLTGFKPTADRVPRDAVLPLSTSLDSIGPIAASVTCCAIIDRILSGCNLEVPMAANIRGMRFAVPQTVVLDGMDETVARAFAATLDKLSAEGALIVDLDIPEFAQLAGIYANGGLVAAEAWHWHKDLIERGGSLYDSRVLSRIMRGKALSAADYIDTLNARKVWIAAVEQKIAGFDALLLPTVPVIAPAIAPLVADDTAFFAANGLILRNPTMINFLDGCALSVPCHQADTAPVGLMIAGKSGDDRNILSIGLAVEKALNI